MHHRANPQIEPSGADEAQGRRTLYYFNQYDESGGTRQLGGLHCDRYRHIDGQWKFVETSFRAHSEVLRQTLQSLAA